MSETTAVANALYQGDNLPVLRSCIPSEAIDLVYLDPPFNSRRSYRLASGGGRSEIEAFEDKWRWRGSEGGLDPTIETFHRLLGPSEMLAYLTMMTPRLQQLRRVLKQGGNIFLHCDSGSSHYLKVLMDAIFGADHFRNEIIWHYGGRGAKAISRQFPRNHDVLLVYSKGPGSRYTRQYANRRYSVAEARAAGFRQDESGRWFKTAPRGDYSNASILQLEAEGRIHRTRNGRVRVKYYLEEREGNVLEEALIGDVWNDIPDAMHVGKERVGYPTQKPEALLERVIRSASEEEDIVLDPFCGSGTALVAAQRLGRRWIGIDSSPPAIQLARRRLEDTFGQDAAYTLL